MNRNTLAGRFQVVEQLDRLSVLEEVNLAATVASNPLIRGGDAIPTRQPLLPASIQEATQSARSSTGVSWGCSECCRPPEPENPKAAEDTHRTWYKRSNSTRNARGPCKQSNET